MSQQLTASKDISAWTLGLSATKHGSQVTTVLHWVVCCEGWVHPCWVHFLWEFPGCWNVVLARRVYICIIVPGRLCSGDNRTVAKLCFPFLLIWVQFTEITPLLVEFFVVKDHLRDGVLFLLDVTLQLCMQRAWHSMCALCTQQRMFCLKINATLWLSPGILHDPFWTFC